MNINAFSVCIRFSKAPTAVKISNRKCKLNKKQKIREQIEENFLKENQKGRGKNN